MTDDRQTPPAIQMTCISKRFAGVVANDDVDFTARWGEVHALIGENGAGKSTLMSILAGLYRPDAGQVTIAGQPVHLRSPRDAIAHGVGMVFQHFMLVDSFTVAENAILGQPGSARLDTAATEQELARLGERYGLRVTPHARVWQLSVGEQQRVEIVRLLNRGAKILVFDEPTAVLTPQESADLIRILRDMAPQGFCIVFISHKLEEVLAVADRITVMRRGRVVSTVSVAETDRRALARLMIGRDLRPEDARELLPETAPPLASEAPLDTPAVPSPVLAVRNLCAGGDKGPPALVDVNLTVHRGEILGIAGVAGNGQRELAETITGLRPATAGRIVIDGRDLTNRPAREIAKAGVAHVPEDRLGTGLVSGLDVSTNAILRDYHRPPLARGPFLAARPIAAFVDRLVAAYDVKTPGRGARVRGLSGGNQQKLLLARELSGNPRLLVAVHPTRGVDIGATETIHRLLREQRTSGLATLLISEDLDELLTIADRIAVLYEGRVMGTVDAAGADREQLGLMMAGVSIGPPVEAPSIAEAVTSDG